MENGMKLFGCPEFGEIRGLAIDNEPWFVGKDIATALGYKDPKDAIKKHVDNEDKKILKGQNAPLENIPNRGISIINESGLYSLILSCKLPNAKKFKRWVTSEVLPEIRKTGGYNGEKKLPQNYMEALECLIEQVKENDELVKQVEEMKPKAEYFDAAVEAGSYMAIRDTAHVLGVKETFLTKFLVDYNYCYRANNKYRTLTPYAKSLQNGYFVAKEKFANKSLKSYYITEKGREALHQRIKKEVMG